MIARWLDVISQYFGWLALALVTFPLVVGVSSQVADRSHTVVMRLWADRPVFLTGFDLPLGSSYQTAADGEMSLLGELLATDRFADSVLTAADASYPREDANTKSALRRSLRSQISVDTDGSNVVIVTYRGTDPQRGVHVLDALAATFRTTIAEIELADVTQQGNVFQAQLDSSRTAMETAIQALNDYVQVHAADRPDELAADSRFISLSADASTRTDAYLSVLARYDEAQQARLGVDPLASAVVRVIDPPTIKPFTFSYKSPAVKAALYAGAAIGALELALVYLLARRDPRLRSGEEIAHRFRIRFLGSIRAARA